jgi:hypothetical protein
VIFKTFLLLTLASSPVMAEAVTCHYYYGGEEHRLDVLPVSSPYVVPNIAVGSYFQFRVVFQAEPADLASVKVYVYADRDAGLMPIHVAVYPYPPTGEATASFGFTGQQFVYEPLRDGEFQYWCRTS